MDYLPIFIDVRARACLVVGGGQVALRKVELLRQAGAEVRVVAPKLCVALSELAAKSQIRVARRPYSHEDIDGVHLIVAATDNPELNARVAADAQARALPVNVVDAPSLCSFIMPAIVDRSPILVAVSTAAASPVLARLIRAQIEAALPPGLGRLAAFAAEHRVAVKQVVVEPRARRLFWERVLEGEIGQLVLAGRELDAQRALQLALTRPDAPQTDQVALIASGDGDPDRLALGALRWLGRADLLLYETGVSARVLGFARRDAERIEIGELAASGGWSFRMLAEAVAQRVRNGGRVCLVRVGDPYERGPQEEALWLGSAGVRFIVVRPAPVQTVQLGNSVRQVGE